MKSCLRWPGGKSRKKKVILEAFAPEVKYVVSPFAGGLSVELQYLQDCPEGRLWVNDLDPTVASFWHAMCNGGYEEIAEKSREFLRNGNIKENGLALRKGEIEPWSFFCLNRISYSGLVHTGGIASDRLNESAIDRMVKLGKFLSGRSVLVSQMDYRRVLQMIGSDPFVFMDPPYPSAKGSNLYKHHGAFRTEDLVDALKNALFRWLVTLDDTEENRAFFADYNVTTMDVTYSMNSKRTTEIIITNY